MGDSSDDPLGSLYAYDSSLNAMYARGAVDDDEAQEAYEQIIRMASPPSEGAADAVLSLAAQLLTKHFHKFPHVNANVVDVLLALSSAPHSQAVRIHSVRSQLQIVKGSAGAKTPLTLECREKMATAAKTLLKGESSTVVVRHLAQLEDALVAFDREEKRLQEAEIEKEEQKQKAEEKRKVIEEKKKEAEEKMKERERRQEERELDEDRKRQEREQKFQEKKLKLEEKRKEREKRFELKKPDPETGDENTSSNRGAVAKESGNRKMRQEKSVKCPPSPYIFVGGVPRGTQPIDIVNFLAAVDGSLSTKSVQIKFPPDGRSAGFAFVNLQSVDLARQCVYHVHTTEFKGRNLIGDFARGPPCNTLHFVERDPTLPMQKVEAVSSVNLKTLDKSVRDELYRALDRFGSFDVLDGSRVEFHDVEGAKAVTRKLTFEIQGRIFLPVYNTDAQSGGDSSRRPRSHHEVMSKTDSSSKRKRAECRESGERRGSEENAEARKRLRSPSLDHKDREKLRRREKASTFPMDRATNHREFNQARYSPSQSLRESIDRETSSVRKTISDRSSSPRMREIDEHSEDQGSRQRDDSRFRVAIRSDERISRQSTVSRRIASPSRDASASRPHDEPGHRNARNGSPSPPECSPGNQRRGSTASQKPTYRSPTPPGRGAEHTVSMSPPRGPTRRSRSPARRHSENGDRYTPGHAHREDSDSASRSETSGKETKPSSRHPSGSDRQRGHRMPTQHSPDPSLRESRELDRDVRQRHVRRDHDEPARSSRMGTVRGNGRSPSPDPRRPGRVRNDSRNFSRAGSGEEQSREGRPPQQRKQVSSGRGDTRDKYSDTPRGLSTQQPDGRSSIEREDRASRLRSRSPQTRNGSTQRHTSLGTRQGDSNERKRHSPTISKTTRDRATDSSQRAQGQKRARSRSPQRSQERRDIGFSGRLGKDGNQSARKNADHGDEGERHDYKRKDSRPARNREEDQRNSGNKVYRAGNGESVRLGERKKSVPDTESRNRHSDLPPSKPNQEKNERGAKNADKDAVEETHTKIDRRPPSPPVGNERNPRTVTPTGSPRKQTTPAKTESPPPSVFKSTSASIYDDIDECMVDYEEDDD